MNALYSVSFLPKPEANKPPQRAVRNVVGASIEEAAAKVRSAFPDCDVTQCQKLQNIDIP